MKNNNIKTGFLSLVTALFFLTACTTNQQLERTGSIIQTVYMETDDLADITAETALLAEKAGKKNVLVVFDIDNTLLAMEQGLGSDQWYEWQKFLAKEDQCNPWNVGDRMAVQGALYFASAMRRTQEDGAKQVKAIQDLGVPVIALTARGASYHLQTFRELRRNLFSFGYSAIGPAGGYTEPFIPVDKGRLSLYRDGVFLTAGQHKGKMLYSLLEKTGTRMPAVVIMVDDKRKNLAAVKETFSQLNVPVRAWRYSGEDMNVENFNPDEADEQWKSIEGSLRQIQQIFGPDNYDLSSAVLPPGCDQPLSSSPAAGD